MQSNIAGAPPAAAASTALPSTKNVLVKVGSGKYLTVGFIDALSMSSGDLLKALMHDEVFAPELAGVALGRCAVYVCTSASKKAPSADEAAAALELEGAETLGDLTASLAPAPSSGTYLFVHVRLPPPATDAGFDGSVESLTGTMGALGIGVREDDPDKAWLSALLRAPLPPSFLTGLPTADDVQRVLASPFPAPIVMSPEQANLDRLRAEAGDIVPMTVSAAGRSLTLRFWTLLYSCFTGDVPTRGRSTEEVWASFADRLTGYTWRRFATIGNLPFGDNRNSKDTFWATSGHGTRTLRPNYCGYVDSTLVITAGHKAVASQLSTAITELCSKMVGGWNQVALCGLPFLPAYAIGGELLQFVILTPRENGAHQFVTVATPVSEKLNTTQPRDRLRIFVAAANMLRVLLWLDTVKVPSPFGDGKSISRRGGSSVTVRDDHVVKLAEPTAPPAVYELLSAGAIPHAVYVAPFTPPRDAGDLVAMRVEPVCVERVPRTESELRRAVRCVLRALAALHAAGYVHRDVRWPNVLAGPLPGQWLLADFELAAADGAPLPRGALHLSFLPPDLLPDDGEDDETGPASATVDDAPVASLRSYFAADDVWAVGRLIQFGPQFDVSRECAAFADMLTAPDRRARPAASAALSHPWLAVD